VFSSTRVWGRLCTGTARAGVYSNSVHDALIRYSYYYPVVYYVQQSVLADMYCTMYYYIVGLKTSFPRSLTRSSVVSVVSLDPSVSAENVNGPQQGAAGNQRPYRSGNYW
jgi:hypothetical protein